MKPMQNAFALVLVLVSAASCGRPATDAECKEIVRRIAELELKSAKVTDPSEIQAHVNATQAAFQQRAMEQCVGKRITDEALACVRSATTAAQIVEQCFD